ncbi:MAG: zinc-dependent alcohol dehydrogenase family protein [Polyangiales bacterium]
MSNASSLTDTHHSAVAMVLDRAGERLRRAELNVRAPAAGELALAVTACGICRTDLHIVDGELSEAAFPIVLGHQIVGRVVAVGEGVSRFGIGDRVGVPWLAWACGSCRHCHEGRENLCERARFTGYHVPGGYAERTTADARFCLALSDAYSDAHAAPLLCAGLIGYRALRMAGEAPRLGLYGMGAAAHLVAQVARYQGQRVFAFTRRGDTASQAFARSLGAVWAGSSDEQPPEALDAAILFAPVGDLVPTALRALARGGRVVCAGIHMSDIPAFPYELLWGERSIASVANLTRRDGEEFMRIAPLAHVQTEITTFPLVQANEALAALRAGRYQGAGVLLP